MNLRDLKYIFYSKYLTILPLHFLAGYCADFPAKILNQIAKSAETERIRHVSRNLASIQPLHAVLSQLWHAGHPNR